MTKILYGVARFAVRGRFLVLGVWLVATVALVAVSHGLGDNTNDNLSLPGTNSQKATDALQKSFPAQANGVSPIVLHAKNGKLTDSQYADAVNQAAADVAKAPHVASVVNPLTPPGRLAAEQGHNPPVIWRWACRSARLAVGRRGAGDHRRSGPTRAQAAGLQVETGGQLGRKVSKPQLPSRELIGILAAAVILTFTFGTVVAMLVPILTAILGLLCDAGDHPDDSGTRATVPTVAPTLATMIGLGVGIDYALFIVTRHFRGLQDGLELRESIARAAATSGGAVFFAGCTVTIALVSLAVAQIPLVTTMGLMAAIAVVVAVLAALTLLPAFLAIMGPHINSLRVPSSRPPKIRPIGGLWAKWAGEIAKWPLDCRSGCTGDPDPAGDPAAFAESGDSRTPPPCLRRPRLVARMT